MNRSAFFAILLLSSTGIAMFPSSGASAAPVGTAVCFLAGKESALPPGIGLNPSRQQIRNRGLSINCSGQLSGRELDPSKPGVWDADVTTGTRPGFGGTGTCLTDGGDGYVTVRLPTTDGGVLQLDGPATYVSVGAENYMEGNLGPYHYVSFVQSMPDLNHLNEDCVTTPVQHWISAGPLVLFDAEQ
ncbi:hypothetical protein NONI108955_11460 [Nocardia ninae]|uniref:Secreted protein n=1 Tax=Nocardia ninae NBRC 108245 TaxID=1210091 RepID=A0A511MRQ8_9NOCA|nr:hypothetical protein [Nocardia ninae]GEM43293.1 hypothetical protein NN4_78120 [Nocardia ninae NBRC 108245]